MYFFAPQKSEAKKRRARRALGLLKPTWKENNNAERIFNLLPERDTRCYSALIRGMVKVGAAAEEAAPKSQAECKPTALEWQ